MRPNARKLLHLTCIALAAAVCATTLPAVDEVAAKKVSEAKFCIDKNSSPVDLPDGGYECVCHKDQGYVGVAGGPFGSQCVKDPGNPIPGGGPGGQPSPLPGGGGGPAGGGTPCDAACQKEKKRKACKAKAQGKYAQCQENAEDARKFCVNSWALDFAVSNCKTGGGPAAGLGVNGKQRGQIHGPIVETCNKQASFVNGKIVFEWVCEPAPKPFGYPEYLDDQLGPGASAWTAGYCGQGGYAQGGCLYEWMNGTGDCSVGGGSATETKGSGELTLKLPTFEAGGGVETSQSQNTSYAVNYSSRTGLLSACAEMLKDAVGSAPPPPGQKTGGCLHEFNKETSACDAL